MKIPLVDLYAQYQTIKPEIDKSIDTVIRESSFIRGPHVNQFEQNFASLMDAEHCISCANGTDAIYIALKMLGIGDGDEVITTAHSWIATSETITQAGAKVVFVDTEEDTFTIDPSRIESCITSKTKAIIPVHLYGQPADMDSILEIANRYGLKVLEDCAQAHLAEYKGKIVGTMGDAATFSFYPGKNLGAYGDAGAIITNDSEFADKCRMFANHGALVKHKHRVEGINSRLDGLQAAILNVKLPYLKEWTAQRGRWANCYDFLLPQIDGLIIPKRREECLHAFHLYVVKVKKRDELKRYLSGQGIGTTIQYPTILPLLPAYEYLGYSYKHFPVAYSHQHDILSLPLYPELSDEKLQYIAGHITDFYHFNGIEE